MFVYWSVCCVSKVEKLSRIGHLHNANEKKNEIRFFIEMLKEPVI